MIKEWMQLFLVFLKIGAFTFGGGYAMLPMLQREIVEKHGWATEEDLSDYYAIGQTTPGIIAVNTATFIGYRKFGVPGAIIATLGLVLPGILIIIGIVKLIIGFSDVVQVRQAMTGIKIAVSVLILEALLKLRKSALIDRATVGIFALVLVPAIVFPQISPVFLVIFAGILGCLFSYRKGVKK